MSIIVRGVGIPPAGIEGDMAVPDGARGVVLFAHGTGSDRHSRRNRFVAEELYGAGFAVLLADMPTAGDLFDAITFLQRHEETGVLKLGIFGASTGGAAALMAAAEWPDAVSAVVSRGGRPDLVEGALGHVRCPTLLIVGGADGVVVEINRHAHDQLRCERELEIIPGAGHLFEEPGALQTVAELTCDWFTRYLV